MSRSTSGSRAAHAPWRPTACWPCNLYSQRFLLVMFAGSGRRYAEHFVFSLHCHSLWFLALLLAMSATNSKGR